ncbi:hypothetical protein DHEL01_v203588 [Diaporthe helianthi]|uniref:Uncharacterized protein n=1 Tax=Diaporthe helianthi TaxID=158607 RepID=A0A2P5I674_DIAHE|nr:hypothetical protein DHEL01_v203588 [Diaporthe helianthi]
MSASHVSTFKKLTTKLDAKLEKARLKMHKTKSMHKHGKTITKPEQTNLAQQVNLKTVELYHDKVQKLPQTNETEQRDAMELQRVGDEVQQISQTTSRETTKQQNKAARRKGKWAARRTAFKSNAKKVGKALLWPVVIVGGFIIALVYLVAEIVFSGSAWWYCWWCEFWISSSAVRYWLVSSARREHQLCNKLVDQWSQLNNVSE